MSAGMAYEAMNNAGSMDAKLIVILNDNDMSIAPPVGAMSAYLSRLISSKPYRNLRKNVLDLAARFPRPIKNATKRAEEYARGLVTGGTLFEEMGFFYVGPIDGHNMEHLLPVLRNVRDDQGEGPILVHVVTQKGKGYAPAEASADKMHGVSKFDVVTGAQAKSKPAAPAYTKVFAQSLIKEAKKDDKIVTVTAAMPSGTGLDLFGKEFPNRTFDVGIAEQHGVTFAALPPSPIRGAQKETGRNVRPACVFMNLHRRGVNRPPGSVSWKCSGDRIQIGFQLLPKSVIQRHQLGA